MRVCMCIYQCDSTHVEVTGQLAGVDFTHWASPLVQENIFQMFPWMMSNSNETLTMLEHSGKQLRH